MNNLKEQKENIYLDIVTVFLKNRQTFVGLNRTDFLNTNSSLFTTRLRDVCQNAFM